jgi:hypothetical protein
MLSVLFRGARRPARTTIHAAARRSFLPRLDVLEDRTVPSTLTVTNLSDTGAPADGSLRGEIAAAAPGDTIQFAPNLSGTISLRSQLEITKSLTVQGPGPDTLTLSGNPEIRVLWVAAGVTASVSGLTVANGGLSDDLVGGSGIYNAGNLSLDRMTVRDNSAEGGSYIVSDTYGGGIFNAPGASLTMSRSTVVNNRIISDGGAGRGGGIFNAGTLSLTDTTVSNNHGPGGLENGRYQGNGAPSATIDTCTFSGNDTYGISSEAATLTLRQSTVSGNGGYGAWCSGITTMDGCTVSGNGAPQSSGGGVYATGNFTLLNCTIAENSGPGLFLERSAPSSFAVSIVSSTIARNTIYVTSPATASSRGGGIDVHPLTHITGSAIQLLNTIVAGNAAQQAQYTSAGAMQLVGAPVARDLNTQSWTTTAGTMSTQYYSLGYNLIHAPNGASILGTTTGNLLGVDPFLGPLADNGGPTRTMALLPGSPAIDAGDTTNPPAYDQRGTGFARVVGAGIDVGAFEAQPAGLMTHFGITAPTGAVAGTPFTISFRALDDFNNPAPGYVGSVGLTVTDGPAVLTQEYTLTAVDAGTHTFSVTLTAAGTQVFTVTAGTPGGLLTERGALTVSPAAATSLRLGAPGTATAGQAVSATVTLQDAYGNRATGYTGTVHFTSSDARAVLPANYTFTSDDAGAHTFSVTLKSAAIQSITATDTLTSGVTGTAPGIVVNAAAAVRFVLTAPASVVHGARFSLTLMVQDAYDNIVTGYTGTVHLISSDGTASLPANYTFTTADAGVHTFATSAILRKKGRQTVTVTDLTNGALTATASINVT